MAQFQKKSSEKRLKVCLDDILLIKMSEGTFREIPEGLLEGITVGVPGEIHKIIFEGTSLKSLGKIPGATNGRITE